MNCPNCGKEMSFGYLSAGGNRILWTPRERKLSGLPSDQDVLIQPLPLSGKNSVRAYHCPRCCKIVADY